MTGLDRSARGGSESAGLSLISFVQMELGLGGGRLMHTIAR